MLEAGIAVTERASSFMRRTQLDKHTHPHSSMFPS